jgi:hypothetical protein
MGVKGGKCVNVRNTGSCTEWVLSECKHSSFLLPFMEENKAKKIKPSGLLKAMLTAPKLKLPPGMVVHICNPCHLGFRDQEVIVQGQPRQKKKKKDPHLNKQIQGGGACLWSQQ